MLAGDPLVLSHGWKPESGFLRALGSLLRADDPLPARDRVADPPHSGRVLARLVTAGDEVPGYTYISRADPLFVHQYSHAWVDFRGRRETATRTDWFENSVIATRAHKAFCLSLSRSSPANRQNVWGITASDSQKGYVAWGGPPRQGDRRHVVPAALPDR